MTKAPDSTDAGWYPDPTDARTLRWWDGTGWTSHVSAKLIETVPRATPSAGELHVRVRRAHAAREDAGPDPESADPVDTSAAGADTGGTGVAGAEADGSEAPGSEAPGSAAAPTPSRRPRRPQLRPRDERAAGRAAFGDLS